MDFSPLKVDDNVTRHLDKVLKRGDWDVLILHYLGLDHIGHTSGPSSPLIGRKLSEMDGVLVKIHTSLLAEVRCWRTAVPPLPRNKAADVNAGRPAGPCPPVPHHCSGSMCTRGARYDAPPPRAAWVSRQPCSRAAVSVSAIPVLQLTVPECLLSRHSCPGTGGASALARRQTRSIVNEYRVFLIAIGARGKRRPGVGSSIGERGYNFNQHGPSSRVRCEQTLGGRCAVAR